MVVLRRSVLADLRFSLVYWWLRWGTFLRDVGIKVEIVELAQRELACSS